MTSVPQHARDRVLDDETLNELESHEFGPWNPAFAALDMPTIAKQ